MIKCFKLFCLNWYNSSWFFFSFTMLCTNQFFFCILQDNMLVVLRIVHFESKWESSIDFLLILLHLLLLYQQKLKKILRPKGGIGNEMKFMKKKWKKSNSKNERRCENLSAVMNLIFIHEFVNKRRRRKKKHERKQNKMLMFRNQSFYFWYANEWMLSISMYAILFQYIYLNP